MSKNIELTRRRVLAGLGTVGVASAGAGLGTSAYFSDTESFENNTLTAGELNLEVSIEIVDASDEFQMAVANGSSLTGVGDSVTLDGSESTVNGQSVSSTDDITFALADVKPGDWWVQKECVRVDGNPAYVNRKASDVTNEPGATTEPEPAAGPEGDGSQADEDHGELGRYLRVRSGDAYDASGSGVQYRYGDTADPISLNGDGSITFSGNFTSNPLDLFFAGTLNHALWAASADLFDKDGDPIYDPDLDMALGAANWNGLTYSNPRGPVDRTGDGNADWDHTGAGPGFGDVRDGKDPNTGDSMPAVPTTIGSDDNADTDEVCVYRKYFVPNEVGNVIQGDSISFSREWRAVQARNNPDPADDW